MNRRTGQTETLQALQAALDGGEPVVLATVVEARGSVPRHAGSKMLIRPDGTIVGTIGGGEMESRVIAEAQSVLASGQPRLLPYALVDPARGDPGVCGGEMQIYLEPYAPPATILIIGGGHVGQAVAELAHWLGYRVVVGDDRPEFASAEHIPDADLHLAGAIDQFLADFPITPHTFVVAVTRNIMIDRQLLPRLLQTPAAYIGVIGSRRRWEHTRKLLREDGLSREALARIHSPIGLELNAETPAEIALSIMAEIVMLSRGGSGAPMSS